MKKVVLEILTEFKNADLSKEFSDKENFKYFSDELTEKFNDMRNGEFFYDSDDERISADLFFTISDKNELKINFSAYLNNEPIYSYCEQYEYYEQNYLKENDLNEIADDIVSLANELFENLKQEYSKDTKRKKR